MKAVAIIAIIVDAVYFSASKSFENYVREFERERFVAGTLEDEYTNSQSWEQIFFTLNCQIGIKLKDMVSFGVINS